MTEALRTVVVVDPEVGFSIDDFVSVWNASAAASGEAVATVQRRPDTYADLWAILGTAANVIGIATFVGVPTVREIVGMLRGPNEQLSESLEIEETTINLSSGQIRKIVIRRRR